MQLHHHLDLLERPRTAWLQAAIKEAVRPGDRFLDAGTGTGILAIWAAQAGASEVIAVDRQHSTTAQALAEANGVADRIQFIAGDLRELDLGAPFEVMSALLYENDPRRDTPALELCALLRERYLHPEGRMIPNRVRYSAVPVDWPGQDHASFLRRRRTRLEGIAEELGTSLGPLGDDLDDTLSFEHFPPRLQTGRLTDQGQRWLASPTLVQDVSYESGLTPMPERWKAAIERAGVCTAAIWSQDLLYGDRLLFRNESIAWLAEPVPVAPGDVLTLALDECWQNRNLLTVL